MSKSESRKLTKRDIIVGLTIITIEIPQIFAAYLTLAQLYPFPTASAVEIEEVCIQPPR
ncbi:hypothetical protein H6G20_10215 [Desertifilum sp. FACHB-1129]|uniref:hypothetical protein n=1 Tax=Desertifilum TaxID=1185872 RepID=UPI001300E363|nr:MULTISPECIES: hypothetical protein [Desertifilum]MBD2312034.1 hypothetical protein [Desertifilum sp. FACHB-1129]MBD2322487.1 hypothetical protein [Desertifilum sp. FACHB-866]MBD2332650.1 hypothetical protein [Desertifilum sp. FACHB-868]MDA0211805.1 hypothetical protein [Cyanobacteria bacterium FC1]